MSFLPFRAAPGARLLATAGGTGLLATALLVAPATAATVKGSSTTTTVHLYILGNDGGVSGTLSPSAAYRVTDTHAGVLESTVQGTTTSTGSYSTTLGWNNGHFFGIHNGDTVTVTDQATGVSYSQVVQLVAEFDDVTGVITGTARPSATLQVKVYTNGGHTTEIGATSLTAHRDGTFTLNVGRTFGYTPPSSPLHPAWRGYDAEIVAQDQGVTDREVWRSIQTPNTTLVVNRSLGSGGLFLSGQSVTFALQRAGSTVASVTTQADADGVPQATIPATVQPGDVMVTSYTDPATGTARTQTLDPVQVTEQADVGSNVVSGQAEPGAPVVVAYYPPSGSTQFVRTTAAADGSYSASFADIVGGQLVVLQQIADPGFTGVGTVQVEFDSPDVQYNDLTGQVTGYGSYGVAPATVQVVRGGVTVATANGTTTVQGAFTLSPAVEVLPGDVLSVTTGSTTLPPFTVGTDALVAYGQPVNGGWGFAGTASAGRSVTVTTGTCVLSATAASDGSWATSGSCPLAGNENATVSETEVGAASDPTAGDGRSHQFNVSAPVVSFTAPGPGASVTSPVTLSVSTWDYDNAAAASKVVYAVAPVGGKATWYTVTTAPFSLTLSLPAGSYSTRAYAYDAAGTLDATGAAIYGQTPVRYFSVG